MQKSNIILVIVAILLFLVGGAVGFLFNKQMFVSNQPLAKCPYMQGASTIISAQDTGLIPTITAMGRFVAISGRNIILASGGKNFEIPLAENAKIYAPKAGIASIPQQLQISDIKIGNALSVIVKIVPNGTLEGQSVTVQPSF